MTYVIASPCIDTRERACVEVCPVDCIHDAGHMLVIDPDGCIDCGACESECPVEAIHHDGELPEGERGYLEVNARLASQILAGASAVRRTDDDRPDLGSAA